MNIGYSLVVKHSFCSKTFSFKEYNSNCSVSYSTSLLERKVKAVVEAYGTKFLGHPCSNLAYERILELCQALYTDHSTCYSFRRQS